MRTLISIISALLFLATVLWNRDIFTPQDYSQVYVKRIIDGDTFVGITHSREDRIRLARIDCPEMDTYQGEAAKHVTDSLIGGKTVRIDYLGRGYYKRMICEVFVDSLNLSDYLVLRGHAIYKSYPKPKK